MYNKTQDIIRCLGLLFLGVFIIKTERNILIAFLLNLSFSIFEFIGGIFTGSVAILSDAVHDMGDALSICASYLRFEA